MTDTTPAPTGADTLRVAAQAALTALENLHEIDTETECITIDVRDEIDALRAALASAAQPPADGALNTIAAMFHSGEEIEGPDGLAMMVDMSVWNDALDAFEGIIGDEMEPAKEQA